MAEATQKTANYTAEMVDHMIEMYNELGNDQDLKVLRKQH
jgi:hypothetical protein